MPAIDSTPLPDSPRRAPDQLPFVAPCRNLEATAPLRWVSAGWQDLRRAPAQSLSYGVAVVAASYGASLVAWQLGGMMLLFGVITGFLFIAPLVAIGVYEISRQLERGETPTLARGLKATRRNMGNELVYALVIMVVFLIWARAATLMSVFLPEGAAPGWRDLIAYLGIGSAVGSIFAALTFSASAFSLPMIADRQTDAVTAVVTSINAVLRNKLAMLVWAAIIVTCLLIGFLTAFVGLTVLMPLLGHATYHSYRDTIDASDWPRAE
jgi:uncharacterized membrane protein